MRDAKIRWGRLRDVPGNPGRDNYCVRLYLYLVDDGAAETGRNNWNHEVWADEDGETVLLHSGSGDYGTPSHWRSGQVVAELLAWVAHLQEEEHGEGCRYGILFRQCEEDMRARYSFEADTNFPYATETEVLMVDLPALPEVAHLRWGSEYNPRLYARLLRGE